MFHTAAIIKTLKRKGFFIMYQIDFHKPMHIHFIGIGGISMSGLDPAGGRLCHLRF